MGRLRNRVQFHYITRRISLPFRPLPRSFYQFCGD